MLFNRKSEMTPKPAKRQPFQEPTAPASGQVAGQPCSDKVSKLSPREWQIAESIWAGCSDKVTCPALGIAPSTLRTHLLRIFFKLEVHTREEVVRQFERHRLSTKRMTLNRRLPGPGVTG